ncbi:MAG: PBSX family phage terminase large subunit [Pseudomonas sp.]|nr:MAG: PBSX family phage terminase large subunit [Pseudomonas sp.]
MQIQLIEAFEALIHPKRIKCFFGGRGAAKSEEYAEKLVYFAWAHGDKVLCGREFQNSIEDSSYALIVSKIDAMGLRGFFDIQATAIYGPNGSCFKFVGLSRNIESLKSKFGYTKVWIEEAEAVSDKTWKVLIPTIREAGSEIWISFNPNESEAATYQRFVMPYLESINRCGFYEDEYIYVRKVSYRDNPYFPETLRIEMERDKKSNYKKYLHIWEGECNADYDDSIIEGEWVDAAIDAHLRLKHVPRGERVLSFDPADSGSDAKATVRRHGMLVEKIKKWTHGDIDDAINIAFDDAFEYRADILVYDNIGVGAGLKVGLKERIANRKIEVQGFGAGDSPRPGIYKDERKNEDTFRNLRAQGWWTLRDRFEDTYRALEKGEYIDPVNLISLSSDIGKLEIESLKAELVRQQRKRSSGSRLIQLVSKEEMRKLGIPSPNMADALMMSFMLKPPVPKTPVVVPMPSHNPYARR